MCIHNLKMRSRIAKGYLILYIIGIISLVTGFFFLSAYFLVPIVSYYEDPGYWVYDDMRKNLGTLWIQYTNIGLILFLLSTFIGGMTDKRLTVEVRRGLLVTSVILSIGLVLFNYFTVII